MKGVWGAAALLAALVFPAGGAGAAEVAVSEENLRQERIYRGEDPDTASGYTVDRALAAYADGLPSGFKGALDALGPADRWLDIGAGEGRAILDYLGAGREVSPEQTTAQRTIKARAVAMSIEDRSTALWRSTAARLGGDHLRYLSGKRLRDYSVAEIGRFQLITDVIGGFSYTDDLSRYMETVLSLLDVGGSFFSVLQDVGREEGGSVPFYEGSPFLTRIEDSSGADMKVCAWLKRIECARVTCESRIHWTPPLEAVHVMKTCENVAVPRLLPVHYVAGTPPERRFRLSR